MTIPTLPPYPSRGSAPDTFSLQADAFVAAMPAWGVAVQAVGDAADADAAAAAVAAATATSAAATAGATAWISGTTYSIGDARYSPADLRTYRRKTAGAGTTDPSADPTNWAPVNFADSLTRSIRTGNTALSDADRGALIDIASGTFTQTFSAAATLGNGWFCHLRNAGSGIITLDPNGAELIDGLTSYAMYPGESRLVMCSGTEFTTVLLTSFKLEPSSTMTFIEPPGYRAYEVFLAAPGGGGGSGRVDIAGTSRAGGGGGKGGTTNWAIVRASTPGSSITLTLGANGLGAPAQTTNSTNGNAGMAGGTHSFGNLLLANGGSGGYGGTTGGTSGGSAAAAPVGMVVSPAGGEPGMGSNASGNSGGNQALWGATGGGGGGGLNTVNAAGSGGAGGASGTTDPSTQIAGGAGGVAAGSRAGGDAPIPRSHRAGTGGGGGAAHASSAGAAGGNGYHGGGGGGGSAAVNGQPSGAGGTGYGYFYVGGII